MIATAAFWRAAALRALYTVLAAALPLVTPVITGGWDQAKQAGLALAFAAALSLATSLLNLPELGDTTHGRWPALADRTVRSFAQILASALAAAGILSAIDWPTVLAQAGAAALITLIRAAIDELPETMQILDATLAPDPVPAISTLPMLPLGSRVSAGYTHQLGTVVANDTTSGGSILYVVEVDGLTSPDGTPHRQTYARTDLEVLDAGPAT